MKLTAEISLYPFNDTHIATIKTYIDKLNQYPDIQVKTFPTATILHGDYQQVMAVISDSVQWGYQEFGRAVFVTKLIPGHEGF